MKSDKSDIKILYVACFYVFIFPILDQGHAIPVIIPLIYYLFANNYDNKKMMFLIKYFIVIGYVMTMILVLLNTNIHVGRDYLKYQALPKGINNYLINYDKYLFNIEKDYKVYLIVENSYMIKLYRNQYPNVYDLLNDGNLGSNPNKYIKEMNNDCISKNCIFILDSLYFKQKRYFQYSKDFKDNVINNYTYLETLPSGDRVYVNNK